MSSNPSEAFAIRAATPADAETIVRHRRAMFSDMRYGDAAWLDGMVTMFRPWLLQKLETGAYLHWFALAPDGSIAAGAGLWLMEWMPHPPGGPALRGNILNVYTEPGYRRQGLARRLVALAVEECRQRGIRYVVLHASDQGRPVYESMGFRATNEMRMAL